MWEYMNLYFNFLNLCIKMFRVILFELMTPYHLCIYYNLHASIKLVNLNIREKEKNMLLFTKL